MTSAAPSTALRRMLRMILMATSALLALGLTMSLLVSGPAAPVAAALIWIGLGLLVLVPILNVVCVLLDEWHARDRRFAAAAVGVLVLLVYTVATALAKNH